jgi:toxin secretion/phage lysis holin
LQRKGFEISSLKPFNSQGVSEKMSKATANMTDIATAVKLAVGMLFMLIDHADPSIKFLLVMIAADYLTGVGAAIVRHEFSWQLGYEGIVRKAMVILFVFALYLGEQKTGLDYGSFRLVAGAFAANEIFSSVQNLQRAGIPVDKVVNILMEKFKSTEPQNAEGHEPSKPPAPSA